MQVSAEGGKEPSADEPPITHTVLAADDQEAATTGLGASTGHSGNTQGEMFPAVTELPKQITA